MKSFRYCLKDILADKIEVPREVPVGNCYQVTLKEENKNSNQELIIQHMPPSVVIVKCPSGQNWLFKGDCAQICDYLIFDLLCNAVILCELKKTFSRDRRREAVEQIESTKKLVQYIIAGVETHSEIGKVNRKMKEHHMMFASKKKEEGGLKKSRTHDSSKKDKLHVFITSKIDYSKIRQAIKRKSN